MTDHTTRPDAGGRPHRPDAPPERIGKYTLRGEIGRGACGVVYQGFDPFVRREVAVKIALQDAATRGDVEHERAFFAEAHAAGMLQHPHIVALYDAGVEDQLSYIVMEFIDGQTLLPLCRPNSARMPLDQIVDTGLKCARALHYAHSKNVLHRDIKPSNIMLSRDGMPKLMDFSIAEIGGGGAQGGRSLVGSPLYMSPEQVARAPLGPPTDLYSLGAVLFQLLTGTPPFSHAAIPELFRAIRQQPAPELQALRPDVPEALSKVVSRLLLKDPAQRFASGDELAAALGRVIDRLRADDRRHHRRDPRDSIRRLHFFSGFADDEVDEILNASTMATYAAGDILIREGEVGNAFFIIAVGAADVIKSGKAIGRLERGDCVGEIGFLSATRRTASVVATTSLLALKIHAGLMDQVSRDCQLRFYKVFTETLIYRLSLTSAKLSALGS